MLRVTLQREAGCSVCPASTACVSSGSRWTVLWGHSEPSPCQLRSCRPQLPLLTRGKQLPSLILCLLPRKSTGKQILRWRWDSRLHFVIHPSSFCQNLIHHHYNSYTMNVSSKIMQINMHSLQSLLYPQTVLVYYRFGLNLFGLL